MIEPNFRTSFADALQANTPASEDPPDDPVTAMLKAIRAHLGMDVAFASEVSAGAVVIRHADTGSGEIIRVGDSFVPEEGYCQRIIDGRLPQLMADTSAFPEAAALRCTAEMPVGAHLSVPIRLSDGRVYGTFCCFSFLPDHSLNDRDLQMMRAFADLAADEIDRGIRRDRLREAVRARVGGAIQDRAIRIVYQPIHRVRDAGIVGVECLARFPDCEARPPSDWFAEAAEVGLGVDLEIAALDTALEGLPSLPEDIYLAVNVSPATILSGRLEPIVAAAPPGRLVIELTEHAAIADYAALADALEPLRGRAGLAIDDVGAGYSGMRHILDLRPDIIKLDISLTRDIDTDPARRALAAALVAFAAGIGAEIVAEGVETEGELTALRELGVPKSQGYYLSRPKPLMAARQFILGERGSKSVLPPVVPRRPDRHAP
jgi:EAL domain-containing protein (putative c-di-GMP-specific phosphodiesterase class I)